MCETSGSNDLISCTLGWGDGYCQGGAGGEQGPKGREGGEKKEIEGKGTKKDAVSGQFQRKFRIGATKHTCCLIHLSGNVMQKNCLIAKTVILVAHYHDLVEK